MAPTRRPLAPATRHRLEELVLLIGRLSNVLNHALEAAGLAEIMPNREAAVVAHLQQFGARRPRELQAVTGLTSGGVTKLIDRLVDAGIVVRDEPDGRSDGRSVFVRLTPAGRRAVRSMWRVIDDVHDDLRPIAKEMAQLCEALGSPTPTSTAPCTDVVECLANLGMVLVSAIVGPGPVTMHDVRMFHVLNASDLFDGCRPGSLVEVVGLSSGGVTKLIDRTVADGLVERHQPEAVQDRRAVVVVPTELGHQRLDSSLTAFQRHLDQVHRVSAWLAETPSVHR